MKLTPEQEAECRKAYEEWVGNRGITLHTRHNELLFGHGFAAGLAARERETEDETAWLIEMVDARWGVGYFWTGPTAMFSWGIIDQAIRFSRKQDADAVISALLIQAPRLKLEACEHMWPRETAKPAPINSPCPECNDLGALGTAGMACPACGLSKPINSPAVSAEPSANTEGAAQSQEPVGELGEAMATGGQRFWPYEPRAYFMKGTKLYTHPLADRPEGWKMVPDSHNMTDEQAEAIANIAGCCGGIAHSIYAAALAAAPPAAPNDAEVEARALEEAWKEAAIAWTVCASIHEKYAKGRDALYSTRNADFVKNEESARAKLSAVTTKRNGSRT